MPLRIITILWIGSALTACDDDTVVEIGEIEGDGAPLRISVPGSARIGEPALIGLITYGDGCSSFERTEIVAFPDEVEVTPYDRRKLGSGCPQILLQFNHDTTIIFDSAGNKVIKIHGRRTGSTAGQPFDEVVQKSFTVAVD